MITSLIPKVEIVEAQVHAHTFITSIDASWCAIRALIYSHAAEVPFDVFYRGELALIATDVAIKEGGIAPKPFGKPLLNFEIEKRFSVAVKAQFEAQLARDLPMMRAVLSLIYYKKMGLNQALEAVEKYNMMTAAKLRKSNKQIEASQFVGKGARTLRADWKRYQKVMPYILAEIVRDLTEHERLSIENLRAMPLYWQDLVEKQSKTKKLNVPVLYAIDFV